MYYFTEKEGHKNANSVCSMLYNYLGWHLNDDVRMIYLFLDACGGQNKNYATVMFLSWLAHKLNVKIEHYFPVGGHWYYQCDRNFGCYSRIIKKRETIEAVPEYVKIFKMARKILGPFEVVPFRDFRTWGKALQPLRNPVPNSKTKWCFSIQKYRVLSFSPDSTKSSTLYNLVFQSFNILKENNEDLPALEYEDEPTVKAAKLNDVHSLMKFVSPSARKWFFKMMFFTSN